MDFSRKDIYSLSKCVLMSFVFSDKVNENVNKGIRQLFITIENVNEGV